MKIYFKYVIKQKTAVTLISNLDTHKHLDLNLRLVFLREANW